MLFINNLNWYSYISHSCLHRTFNTFKCLGFFKKAITQNKLMYSAVKKEPKERMPQVSLTKNNIYAAFNSLFISLSSGRANHICNMTTWSWKQLWKHFGNCSLYSRSLKFSLKLFNVVWNSIQQIFSFSLFF